jgi:hypothetical protein
MWRLATTTVDSTCSDYRIGVTSYAAGETGAYTLRVEPGQEVTGPATPIAFGIPLEGELAQGDVVLPSGKVADLYSFTGSAGQVVTVMMRSPALDTYLELTGPGDFAASNDDSPGLGTDSRIEATLPSDGQYQVVATTYAAGMLGSYTLTLSSRSAAGPPPEATNQLTAGSTVSGALQAGDATLPSGELYDVYHLSGEAGQQIVLSASSSEFDTYLMLRGPSLSVDNDDVDPGNLDSQLNVTLPETATYSVSVTSYSAGETGSYTLSFTVGGTVSVEPQALEFGQTASGTLSQGDPMRRGGEFYRPYAFTGTTGQRIRLSLSSDAIDTYLVLRMPNGFEETNDDIVVGEDTNSQLDLVLPADGRYEVQASSYWTGETGPFQLSLALLGEREAVEETAAAPPGTLAIGAPVTGRLEAGDGQLETGEFIDSFTFLGEADQLVTFTVESDEFDTWLILDGQGLNEQNDDGVGIGLNSRIEITLPQAGQYTLTVTSYEPGETGSYTLSAVLGTALQNAGRGEIYGVFAGLTDYADTSDLPYCADDATKLHQTLSQTGLLAEGSIVLTNAQVTRAALRDAFRQVAAQAGPDDVFLFFYSGHGNQLENNAPGEPDNRDETIYVYDGDISDDELASWFDEVHARVAVVALDSCFSGGFARDIVTQPNRMGIFSSEEDVLSNVADRFQAGGFLSYFLRVGLSGEADTDPADRVITVGELTQYLRLQWARHMLAETTETAESAITYQNLVVERGGVKVTDILVYPKD